MSDAIKDEDLETNKLFRILNIAIDKRSKRVIKILDEDLEEAELNLVRISNLDKDIIEVESRAKEINPKKRQKYIDLLVSLSNKGINEVNEFFREIIFLITSIMYL